MRAVREADVGSGSGCRQVETDSNDIIATKFYLARVV
jgi:hypothetical protein